MIDSFISVSVDLVANTLSYWVREVHVLLCLKQTEIIFSASRNQSIINLAEIGNGNILDKVSILDGTILLHFNRQSLQNDAFIKCFYPFHFLRIFLVNLSQQVLNVVYFVCLNFLES